MRTDAAVAEIEGRARALFDGCCAAREGLSLTVGASEARAA
jgi:hypothetical protein